MSQEDKKIREVSLIPFEDDDGNDRLWIYFNGIRSGYIVSSGNDWAVYARRNTVWTLRGGFVETQPTVYKAVDALRKHLERQAAA